MVGRRPSLFTLPERREIKEIAKSKPVEHGLPFSTWSLAKLADFLVAEGVVDDISHEGLRVLLREEGVSFQHIKTWKTSRDPDYAAKKARVEHLFAIADGEVIPEDGEPEVVLCVVGTRILIAALGPGGGRPTPVPHGVQHLFAAYDLTKDQLYGHIKKTKNRSKFEFCRYLRSLHPVEERIALVCDNYSPHLTTKRCRRVETWTTANNVEIAYTPTNSSWLNPRPCATSLSTAPTTPATWRRAA